MPRRDGTGPMGIGAMSGRRMGFCNGSGNFIGGYGFGCRRGFGGRFLLNHDTNPEKYKSMLIQEKSILEDRLGLIKKELEGFEDSSSNE